VKARPISLLDIKFDLIISGRVQEEIEILIHKSTAPGSRLPRTYHIGTANFATCMGESTVSAASVSNPLGNKFNSIYEMASL